MTAERHHVRHQLDGFETAELLRGNGPVEPESLTGGAAHRGHQPQQVFAFDMLGDAGYAEQVAQADDRLEQALPVAAVLGRGYQCAVELDLVEPQLPQIADRGIAGPEIVEER